MKSPAPLHVQVRNLPTEGIRLEGEVSAHELEIEEDDRTSFPSPVWLALQVTPVHGALVVDGRLRLQLHCRCDRCLSYYTVELPLVPVAHQYLGFHGDILDLTEDIRDDIVLAFPQRNLCRAECRGLCPECGQNLNVRDCGCRSENQDAPTWGALNSLNLPAEGAAEDAGGGTPES